jgi:hypothetical protein
MCLLRSVCFAGRVLLFPLWGPTIAARRMCALPSSETELSDEIYQVVHITSGEPYEGTLPLSRDREALVLALAEMLESAPYWRGKLEVRRK